MTVACATDGHVFSDPKSPPYQRSLARRSAAAGLHGTNNIHPHTNIRYLSSWQVIVRYFRSYEFYSKKD